MIVLVPSSAPTEVPTASAAKAWLKRGSSPRSSMKPARRPTPISVPAVSKMSTNRKARTTAAILPLNRPAKSRARKVSRGSPGRVAKLDGAGARPLSQAVVVTARMPMRIAPREPTAISAAISSSPARASSAPGCASGPSVTSVSGWSTTRPAFCSPMIARKSPIPAMVASLIESGIARTSASWAPVSASARKSRPSTKTAASAICQATPRPRTTPKVK